MAFIEVKNLCKVYGKGEAKVKALDNINLKSLYNKKIIKRNNIHDII